MKNILLKSLLSKSRQKSSLSQKSEAGFSLLEVVVIVLIIGIFSAIAAPAWDTFVTRQRIRTVNNQVLRTLQTAQAEAKLNKEDVTVTFFHSTTTPTADPPEYQIGTQPTQTLNLEGEVPDGQIQIDTQANGNAEDSITFNYLGAVEAPEPQTSDPSQPTDGFTVSVFPTNGGTRRCVKVMTLLGVMITAEGGDCP